MSLNPHAPARIGRSPGAGDVVAVSTTRRRLDLAESWPLLALHAAAPLVILGLWLLATSSVDLDRMNDLGLVSVLPATASRSCWR